MRVTLAVAIVLGIGVAGGWAAKTVFMPTVVSLDNDTSAFIEVSEGEIGSSLNLVATAEWTTTPAGNNRASGTVTSVNVEPGQQVISGNVLYSVNLRPVVIAQGALPAFSTLEYGMKSQVVAQLQTFLSSGGYFRGANDGFFGEQTRLAVMNWQRSTGLPADGHVRTEDIIFVPKLPARVSLDPTFVERGRILTGGEAVLRQVSDAPVFSMDVTEAQGTSMAEGVTVKLQATDGDPWLAVVGERSRNDQQQVLVNLVPSGDTSICGTECDALSVGEKTLIPANVVIVETVRGLVVPNAALVATSNGGVALIDSNSTEHAVRVLASARGFSVVEGVEAGLSVKLPSSGP
ncbi:peptidoglycan-binding protein [Paenarthrobacter sp. NPDC089989]|uniref:peptidoglycan-binding domain-containing protein n=1 Tax=unclassified Paenarthrobacter TaxID=2634190 RepID=UPI0037F50C64